MSVQGSRFPIVREQLASWRLFRDRRAWQRAWWETRRAAWKADGAYRCWHVLGWIGLIGIAGSWWWLALAQSDWRALATVVTFLALEVIAGSQAMRRIDDALCRSLTEGERAGGVAP